MDKKRPLIPFTGGLDSTALLVSMCKKIDNFVGRSPVGRRDDELEPGVVYIRYSGSLLSKTFAELRARHQIMEHLRKKEYSFLLEDTIYEYWGDNQLPLIQMTTWITMLAHAAKFDMHSRVMIAYVSRDEALYYIPHLRKVWEGIQTIVNGEGRIVPLEFPLATYSKRALREYLKNDHPEVLDMIWSCELPLWDETTQELNECGTCEPCIRKKLDEIEAGMPKRGLWQVSGTIAGRQVKRDECLETWELNKKVRSDNYAGLVKLLDGKRDNAVGRTNGSAEDTRPVPPIGGGEQGPESVSQDACEDAQSGRTDLPV